MFVDIVLKKTSALSAAMLIMAAAWFVLHLPGADLPMVTFSFLASAALCGTSDIELNSRRCIQLVCGAASVQFLFGITAEYPLIRVAVAALCSFFVLAIMPDRQCAIIVLLIGYLTLSAPSGLSASLNRAMDIVFAGAVVTVVTTLCNLFTDKIQNGTLPAKSYTYRQAAVITAELTVGFIIAQIFDHAQFVWIMLAILFVHMAKSPRTAIVKLSKQRLAATPLGIFLGGIYLASLCNLNYRWIYIVPLSGTLAFFVLYAKNDYFWFTVLFMFSLTVFTDWMLGTGNRFHFAEVMLFRSLATVIGGILLLTGKNLMQKDDIL